MSALCGIRDCRNLKDVEVHVKDDRGFIHVFSLCNYHSDIIARYNKRHNILFEAKSESELFKCDCGKCTEKDHITLKSK